MAIHELSDPTFEFPDLVDVGKINADRSADETHQSTEFQHSPFSNEELGQFKADDIQAGRTIGKLLSTLFIYTVIIMSVVIWWTLVTDWNQ